MSYNIVPLPNNDLWRPYDYEENGDIKPRADTIDASKLPPTSAMRSPDVAAILMEMNARALAEANKAQAAKVELVPVKK